MWLAQCEKCPLNDVGIALLWLSDSRAMLFLLTWLLSLNMPHQPSLGFCEYFRESIRGLTGTPPTPLNVAALCHLTAVPIFLPYPDRDARWKQKGRQEDFNIALRSHTICPFHEPADGRGGNTSPHYKQTAAYFKVTRKSQRLQGSSGAIAPDIVKSPRFGFQTIAQP